MITRFRTFLVMALMASPAQAQSLGYLDAETQMGAVHMLVVTMRNARFVEEKCKSLFPEKSEAIDRDFGKWKAAESKGLAKAEALWPRLVEREPEFEEVAAYAVDALRRQFESMQSMPRGRGTAVLDEVCSKYFVQLASGVWRKRTPRAYEFIDQLP